jgi:peptidoglycan/xylan/chitin deacetylase (PgdA/CDA1 family)
MSTYKVTLSFDNGPEPDVTPMVLDVLKRCEVKATFFVLGEKLADDSRMSLVRRAREEGHWIGNHTFSHIPLGQHPQAGVAESEIGRTQDLIGDQTHEARYFRPTGGDGTMGPSLLSSSAADFLKNGNFSVVLWNCVPEDWIYPDGWVETALQQCASQEHAVVVLHDLPTGAMVNLEHFIEQTRIRGGMFVQDFPDACMPMVKGIERHSMAPYISDAKSSFTGEKNCV